MKKYRLLLQVICLMAVSNIFAETGQSLVVFLKSGNYVCIPVNDNPKIEFEGTIMHVGSNDFQIENVSKWIIGDADEIISGIIDTKSQNGIRFKDDFLIVGNLKDIQIYNVDGMKLPARVDRGKIDMTSWPRDIYVIKAGKETIKIKKQ